MTPRASFVIPAYNAQAFIGETLQSCLEQTVKQIEIVVVNDGSKDNTAEIIDAMAQKDGRIRPIHLQTNVGRSEARNIGNKESKSDIILVLDADDRATRNRVKDTLACFSIKKPDLIYGGFVLIDTFNNMEKRFAPEPFSRELSIKSKTHHICHSTMAYRKGLTLNVQYSSGDFSRLGMSASRTRMMSGSLCGMPITRATSSPTSKALFVTIEGWTVRLRTPETKMK